MKEITLFMFDGCPHCKRARDLIEQLKAVHPEYGSVPFKMIDEKKEPEVAAKYDYYYVPTFYVGSEKLHEGRVALEDVEKVFKAALE